MKEPKGSPEPLDPLEPAGEAPVDSQFDSLMEQGLGASRRDDVASAIGAWQSAAAARPESALPHFLMGAEYAQAGRTSEAESAYANAVLLAPEFETARYQLGLLQFTSRRAALAHVTWEPLFRLPEGHPIRSFVLGFSALARDEFETALAHFGDGMAANRDNLPMNSDIAHVVGAIRRLRSGAPGDAPSVTGSAPEAHVLLEAYRRQGSVH